MGHHLQEDVIAVWPLSTQIDYGDSSKSRSIVIMRSLRPARFTSLFFYVSTPTRSSTADQFYESLGKKVLMRASFRVH